MSETIETTEAEPVETTSVIPVQPGIQKNTKAVRSSSWQWQLVAITRNISWTTWAGVGLSLVVTVVLVFPNFLKKPPETTTTVNPLKPLVQLPAYNEAKFSETARAELDDTQQQLAYFLNEESQRTRLTIALGFMGLASSYAQKGEDCKTQIACLESFSRGRTAELEQLLEVETVAPLGNSDGNALAPFVTVLQNLNATEKVEGWRLAMILAKPAEARSPAEKWELNTRYPILQSGVPIESLTPRPAMLQALLKAIEKKRLALRAASPEEQARFERQQRICESTGQCS